MEERWPLFPKDFPKCGGFVFFLLLLLFWMDQLAHGLVVTFLADCSSL